MTDSPGHPTERLQPPPPPAPDARKPSAWDRFRTDPVKPLIVGAALGVFGFGALAFTAGYWVGHADRGDYRVIERMQGPRPGLRSGQLQFRHPMLTPPGQTSSPSGTTAPSPPTSAPS